MVKGLGMNGISVYVMWNYHELAPGQWDFETGSRNLPLFLSLAHQLGLKVFIRPGPYVCAEWDYGGFPAYLLKNRELKVRANNDYFMGHSERYIKKVADVIRPFLHPSGPVLLVQLENEYGGWGNDLAYIRALHQIWLKYLGPFEYYVVDHIEELNNTVIEGVSVGLNGFPTELDYSHAREWYPTAPTIFGGEVYPGWFTHWGDAAFQKVSVE
jgi:beta-galactosidase